MSTETSAELFASALEAQRETERHQDLVGKDYPQTNFFQSNYVTEKYQRGILRRYLEDRGFQYQIEARIYQKPIDMLGIDDNDMTVAIEMKSDGRVRGLKQASRNTSYVNYSYLSVWSEKITQNLIDRVENEPIGLLAVDDEVECLSEPSYNSLESFMDDKIRDLVEK